jgi:formyltetrahydrofolate deformylase
MRIVSEHDYNDATITRDIRDGIRRISGGEVETHDTADKFRVAFLVSRERHCLDEIVMAHRRGELDFEPVFVGSNYSNLEETVTEEYGWKFRHFPLHVPGMRNDQEDSIIAALAKNRVDILILAKYMSILSPSFIERFPHTVNTHHSFLPAFKGRRPYEQAYNRGVKLIAATTHFITKHLDKGPIIAQMQADVDGCSLEEMKRRGRTLERLITNDTLFALLERRVIRYGRKAHVFH